LQKQKVQQLGDKKAEPKKQKEAKVEKSAEELKAERIAKEQVICEFLIIIIYCVAEGSTRTGCKEEREEGTGGARAIGKGASKRLLLVTNQYS
jgi:hypothetical protein